MEQQIYTEFLPISRADMEARGWDQLDFVVVGGDAYVDHPSFGTAIISRLLEAEGYKIGVLAQPRYTDCEDFKRFGKPKYGFFIGGGNVDSMVSHYSVAKIPRAEDEYSPGGKGGARPDRSATVYTKLAKEAYPDLPVILGGLEASLRRFAHYDYWLDTVLPSIAEDSGADIISYGMGEHQTVEIARRLAAGEPVESITDVDGTYSVRPHSGKTQPGNRRGGHAAPVSRAAGGRQPSPGARFAPNGTHKPKNNQQKENATWKTSKKKK